MGLNLKALFTADTSGIKKGSKEATESVRAFNDQATGVMDEFTSMFGASISGIQGQLTAFKGGLTLLSSSFSKAAAGSTAFSRGLGILKVALISTGIGAIVVALGSLVAYFAKSQDGADKLAKVMAVLKAIFGTLMDVVINLGRKIVWAFENPKQAISNLWQAIKTNIINRVNGLIETFGSLGKLIGDVFSGRWSNLQDDAKKVAQNFAQTITGFDENQQASLLKTAAAFGKNVKEKAALAAKLAEMEDDIEDKKRAFIKEEAILNAKLSDLRQKSMDKESYNATERIKFTEQAEKVFTTLWNKRVALAQAEYETANQIYKLKNEHSDEEEENLNNLFAAFTNLNAARSDELKGFQREQRKIIAQYEEEIAQIKRIQELKGRAKIEDVSVKNAKTIEKFDKNGMPKIQMPKPDLSALKTSATETKEIFIDLSQVISASMEDLAINFGVALGNLIAGTGNIGDLGRVILSSLADLIIMVGKTAIQAGIGMEAIKKAFAPPFPGGLAIAIGVGLVAFGTVLKSGLAGASSSVSSSGMFSGGSSSGSTLDARSNNLQLNPAPVNVNVTGQIKGKGSDLVVIIENENNRKKLTS